MMYSEPNFKIIKLSQEDILQTSNNWEIKDKIEVDGYIEFQ